MTHSVQVLTDGNRCLKVKINLSSDIRLLRVYLNVINFIPYTYTLRMVGSAKDLGDETVLRNLQVETCWGGKLRLQLNPPKDTLVSLIYLFAYFFILKILFFASTESYSSNL